VFARWSSLVLPVALLAAGCGGDGGEPGPDTAPPGVLSTVPADGETGVDPEASIHLVFDEEIDRPTLVEEMLHLERDGQPLYGKVSYDLDQHRATLSMKISLEAGTTYQAVLEPGVRDLAGNRMSRAHRWSFTVRP